MFAGDEERLTLRQNELLHLLEAAAAGLHLLLGTPKHSDREVRAAAADAMRFPGMATAGVTAATSAAANSRTSSTTANLGASELNSSAAQCTVLAYEDVLAWSKQSAALAPYLQRATADAETEGGCTSSASTSTLTRCGTCLQDLLYVHTHSLD